QEPACRRTVRRFTPEVSIRRSAPIPSAVRDIHRPVAIPGDDQSRRHLPKPPRAVPPGSSQLFELTLIPLPHMVALLPNQCGGFAVGPGAAKEQACRQIM